MDDILDMVAHRIHGGESPEEAVTAVRQEYGGGLAYIRSGARERRLAIRQSSGTPAEIARRYGVCEQTVRNLKKR